MINIASHWKEMAGNEETAAGLNLCRCGGVRIAEEKPDYVRFVIRDTERCDVTLHFDGSLECTCSIFPRLGSCRHIVAALQLEDAQGILDRFAHKKAAASAETLLGAMESSVPHDGTMHLDPVLRIDSARCIGKIQLGLRIGEDKLYTVKSIPGLLDALNGTAPVEYGKGFILRPEWMRFDKVSAKIMDLVTSLVLAEREVCPNMRTSDMRFVTLPDPFAEQLFNILEEIPFKLTCAGTEISVKRIREARIPVFFNVSTNARCITIDVRMNKDILPLTSSFKYAVISGQLVKIAREQRTVMKVLLNEMQNGVCSFDYQLKDTDRVFGELVPFLKIVGSLEIDQKLRRKLVQLPLVPQLYLDRDGKDVICKVLFKYGDREIDPFDEQPQTNVLPREGKILLRDASGEHRVLDSLGNSGFFVGKGRVYLSGSDEIYDFVTEGLSKLQEICEVFLSKDFRKISPRKPLLHGSLRIDGEHIEIKFTDRDQPTDEILGIMDALNKHRRYFRMKDGSFLDLTSMGNWTPLAETIIEAASMEGISSVSPSGDVIQLQAYRACYLKELLDEAKLPITVDKSLDDTVHALLSPDEEKIRLPQGLDLRPYQQTGFKWLRTLDKLHMGGILADDMGLGKTVQVIALLMSVKGSRKKNETSLVIAPSSLTFNWLSEINRFAPGLSVMVMSGSAQSRESQMRHVAEAGDIDVLITSYPLIRRDVGFMKDFVFRFIILDEAQHVKNAGSVGAIAVKQLNAKTRFALTGTPMENGMGELWSIFDFVLPGYLMGYSAFLHKYQEGENLDDLRRKIRPFLLRRLKKDVLAELPDKEEVVMTASMTPEQEKVYQAAKLRLRDRVDRIMSEKGLGRGRTEVLSAITELRQICCHPQLVMPEYAFSSGKLDMLLDILPGATDDGHRVLLFSQFTSVLKIIKKQLDQRGFDTMYLDGDTPPAVRIELTEQFNGGKGQIFLISREAGGTGLNLTGADMVIHYDPWWNPAAEDQATDRAYRIGQTKNVSVFRLVTHDSIEEQVVALGQRKKALFDQLITPGEQLITGLSEQDIRSLFA